MNKRFKEYRMFLFCLVLFVLIFMMSVMSFVHKDPMRLLAMFILLLVTLFILTTRFKIILFEDMMMIYKWKYVALLPEVIAYKDIESVERKSKHRVEVHHQSKSSVYVWNSDKFIEAYHEIRKDHG